MPNPFEEFKRKREAEQAAASTRAESDEDACRKEERQERELIERKEAQIAQYDPLARDVLGMLRDAVYPDHTVLSLINSRGWRWPDRHWSIAVTIQTHHDPPLNELVPAVLVGLQFDATNNATHFECLGGARSPNALLTYEDLVATLTKLQTISDKARQKADRKGLLGRLFR